MKRCSKKNISFFLIFLIICITSFIFINSAIDSATSHKLSQAVTDIVTVNKFVEKEQVVRKSAHIIEFALLGVSVVCWLWCRGLIKRFANIVFAFLYFLSVALVDELIQVFSNRTNSVKDVGLDFLGALIGSVLILAVYKIFTNRQKKNTLK